MTAVAGMLVLLSCGKDSKGSNSGDEGGKQGGEGAGQNEQRSFITGADISWVTEMEDAGISFNDSDGTRRDLFDLLKSVGMDMIRLRIWVNPEDGWCGYEDVLAKARRAQSAGMSVMLDFHYSDFFADPGTQTPPTAWTGKTHAQLAELVRQHTSDFLTKLKLERINPTYIQIGNETRNGMLWPDGQLWNTSGDISGGWRRYAELSNAGYDAAKAVFPSAKVFVHLNHAFEDNEWWFDRFISEDGKTDIIGLSHYPQVDKNGSTPAAVNAEAVSNIAKLAKSTKKDIFIVETGIKSDNLSSGAAILKSFIESIRATDSCVGILYWEPEVYGGWKPSKYSLLGWNAYDMGAFTSNGRVSDVVKLFTK